MGLCSTPRYTKPHKQTTTKFPNIFKGINKCTACTQSIEIIQTLLSNQTTEDQIKKSLISYCHTYPSPYDTICVTIVETSLPTLIQLIAQGTDASTLCNTLGFCSTKKALKNKPFKNQYTNRQDVTACTCCTQSVDLISLLLANGTSFDDIVSAAVAKCRTFPSPYDAVCVNFAELYTRDLVGYIEQGMGTLELCTLMGFCQPGGAVNKVKTAVKVGAKKSSFGCDMCSEIVGFVKSYMDQAGVPPAVDVIVEKLCSKYPSPYDTLCHAVADECLGMIVEWIKQGLDAADICAMIGFCQANPTRAAAARRGKSAAGKNGYSCDMCTSVVNYIAELVADEATKDEITVLVEQLCTTFPSPYDATCKSLVAQHLPAVLDWISAGLTASDICAKIGFCNAERAGLARAPRRRKAGACEACKRWFAWVRESEGEARVEALWRRVAVECARVPALKDFCQTLNEQNVETYAALARSGMPAEECCEWIKAC